MNNLTDSPEKRPDPDDDRDRPSPVPGDPTVPADPVDRSAEPTGPQPAASGSPPAGAAGTPAAGEPVLYTLDRRMIRAEQTGDLMFTAVLFLGAAIWIAFYWSFHGIDLFWQILVAAAAVVVGTSFCFSIFWPCRTFRHTRWGLDESGLEIHKGVLWRHRIVVPMSRVQHADVSQGPLQRSFGLGTLTVHTAGTSNASVDLAGLDHAVALRMRDQIVRTRSDQHV